MSFDLHKSAIIDILQLGIEKVLLFWFVVQNDKVQKWWQTVGCPRRVKCSKRVTCTKRANTTKALTQGINSFLVRINSYYMPQAGFKPGSLEDVPWFNDRICLPYTAQPLSKKSQSIENGDCITGNLDAKTKMEALLQSTDLSRLIKTVLRYVSILRYIASLPAPICKLENEGE